MSESSDDKRIKALLDYFTLADQGSPEVLDLFHEDVELYFPKFGFGVGRQAFLEFVKRFEGTLEFIRHDYDKLTFISPGITSSWREPRTDRCPDRHGSAERRRVVVSATSSRFATTELRASTSTWIPITRERMCHDSDGVGIADGDGGQARRRGRRPVKRLDAVRHGPE